MRRVSAALLCTLALLGLGITAVVAQAARPRPTGPVGFFIDRPAPPMTLKAEGAELTCTESETSGKVTGVRSGTLKTRFEGCEAFGKKCQSAAAREGEIRTNLLAFEIGYIKAPGEVGIDITARNSGEALFEFACPGEVAGRVKGSVIGRLASFDIPTKKTALNQMEEVERIDIKEKAEKQEVESFEGGSSDTLTLEVSMTGPGGLFLPQMKTREITAQEVSNDKQVVKKGKHGMGEVLDPSEIRTTGPALEIGRCYVQKKPRGQYVDAGCQTKASGKAKGRYEWFPVPF